MLLFQFVYELKDHLQGVSPYDTGNLANRGINVKGFGNRQMGIVIGGVQAPYAIALEKGFTHYISGKFIDKHKGWSARATREFAQKLATDLGGVVSYD